jgi:hypothetical protein
VVFQHKTGNASIALSWSSLSMARTVIPSSQFLRPLPVSGKSYNFTVRPASTMPSASTAIGYGLTAAVAGTRAFLVVWNYVCIRSFLTQLNRMLLVFISYPCLLIMDCCLIFFEGGSSGPVWKLTTCGWRCGECCWCRSWSSVIHCRYKGLTLDVFHVCD